MGPDPIISKPPSRVRLTCRARILRLLPALCLLLLCVGLSGCINIIHFLERDETGRLLVRFRVLVSAGLAELSQQGQPGEQGGTDDLRGDMARKRTELERSMGEAQADHLVVTEIDGTSGFGYDVSFDVPGDARIGREPFPLLPSRASTEERLVFQFRAEKKKGDKNEMLEGAEMEALTNGILGTARYQLFLGRGISPKRAYVTGPGAADRHLMDLEVLALGTVSLIEFPVLVMEQKAPKGYDLVVEL